MKSSQMKVSDLGEKGIIERIIERSKLCSQSNMDLSNFATSIGDDSALTNITMDENSYLVSSTDMLIEHSHFPYGMTYFQMGYKAVVVNVSDLASMGADNIGFLLNIAIPKDTLLDDFDELICGVIKACDEYDIPLIGGDTNQAGEIIISGTAIGQVDKDKALMKYGFQTGDLVCISEELGLAALGFELLNLKKQLTNNLFENVDLEKKLKAAYEIDSSLCEMAIFKALKPEARYLEGHILRDHNTKDNRLTATDITDGLASEFYEIINSDKKFTYSSSENLNDNYKKGIRIYEDKLPVEEEYKEIADALGLDYLDLFLHVGEDFEFLFTINKELKNQLSDDMNFYIIGEIIEKNTLEIVLSNGDIKNISSEGYQHLK
ncbi:thiamine-phosphate kinase [uncultured Methanobrevibacter sp.]|uniref:thiamine-phosphate kinase n=1 Tax=uncultured Methanobrevibacter sp. TaxID=253161 RepID=UPI0025E32012|nr:thiamine-phosphate kinase [uncultured Methanobrevibacter sp.]